MLPRPATIATPPSTTAPTSWNPAVAPPPVTGAPMGAELDDGLEAGWGLALCDVDGLALVLALADELGLVLVLALVLVRGEEPPLAVLVAVELTVELVPAEGMNVDGGGVEAGLEVQAESATQASMVVRPQPTTVSRTRCDVHAMAVRALIEPPRVLGNDHFPVAARRNEENVGDLNVKPER
jgi:hypothetical protein